MEDPAVESISESLERALKQGEGQDVEFMVSFPTNTHDLAKEIAAFATINAGTIFLGVSDAGEVVGLKSIEEPEQKDQLRERIVGVCHGTVRPAIICQVDLVNDPDGVVAVIQVPKGPEPVYYCVNTPYIRDNTRSRPAEPHEVKALHERYLKSQVLAYNTEARELTAEERGTADFVRGTAWLAASVLGEWHGYEVRNASPHLQSMQLMIETLRDEAFRLAFSPETERIPQIADDLKILGQHLGGMAGHRWSMGREVWDAWVTEGEKAATAAKALLTQLATIRVPSRGEVEETVSRIRELLSGIRATWEAHQDSFKAGRVADLQAELGYTATLAAKYAHILLSWGQESLAADLLSLATALRRAEVRRVYLDGGASLRQLNGDVTRALELGQTIRQQITRTPEVSS